MRDELLPYDRIRAIQEELTGFFVDQVIHQKREYHTEIQWEFVKEICPRGNNKVIIYFLIS